MKKVFGMAALFAVIMVGLLSLPLNWAPRVSAQHFSPGTLNVQLASLGAPYDPCQNPLILKSSAVINVSSATTTELVAPVSGLAVYTCNATLTAVATGPTFYFEYGTSTACTGTHALTGTYAPTTGSFIKLSDPGTQFVAPASQGLCVVTGGSGSPSFQGHLDYVQQ